MTKFNVFFIVFLLESAISLHALTPTPTITRTLTATPIPAITATPTPLVFIRLEFCVRKNVGAIEPKIPAVADTYLKGYWVNYLGGDCFLLTARVEWEKINTAAKRNNVKNYLLNNNFVLIQDWWYETR